MFSIMEKTNDAIFVKCWGIKEPNFGLSSTMPGTSALSRMDLHSTDLIRRINATRNAVNSSKNLLETRSSPRHSTSMIFLRESPKDPNDIRRDEDSISNFEE